MISDWASYFFFGADNHGFVFHRGIKRVGHLVLGKELSTRVFDFVSFFVFGIGH